MTIPARWTFGVCWSRFLLGVYVIDRGWYVYVGPVEIIYDRAVPPLCR